VPTTRHDFDNIRWYLMHPGVRVYVEDTGQWFIQFMSRCQNLGADNLCKIYDTRPQICRELQPTECEFALGPGDQHYFTTLAEFESWAAERTRARRARAARRAAATRRSKRRHRGARANGRG
jgi:Fe-S-cluster containining protein